MVDKERIFAYFKVSNSAEKFLKNQTNVDLIILNNFHFPAPTTQPGHVQQPQAAPEVRKSVKTIRKMQNSRIVRSNFFVFIRYGSGREKSSKVSLYMNKFNCWA